MAAGATHAPAIARAISFLFIRISFVEGEAVVACERFLGGRARRAGARFYGTSTKFLSRSHSHDAKALPFAQGVFGQSRNKPGRLLCFRHRGSEPRKDLLELLSGVLRGHKGTSN